MVATSLPSAAANGTRRHCTKGATIWRRTCASSRRRTRRFCEREGVMALKAYALTCGHLAFDYRPGEEIGARLAALGRDPAKIDLIINSHFHFDHVGGNAQVPNATMIVQRREWDAGMDPDSAVRRGFNPRDFDLGHKLRLVDGEHDVFGDGSVVCLPTHGHTPGHQSLRLRLDSGEV